MFNVGLGCCRGTNSRACSLPRRCSHGKFSLKNLICKIREREVESSPNNSFELHDYHSYICLWLQIWYVLLFAGKSR